MHFYQVLKCILIFHACKLVFRYYTWQNPVLEIKYNPIIQVMFIVPWLPLTELTKEVDVSMVIAVNIFSLST